MWLMVEIIFLCDLGFTKTNTYFLKKKIIKNKKEHNGGIEIPNLFPTKSNSQITPIIIRQQHQSLGNLSYYTLVTPTLRNPKVIKL